MAFTSVSSSSLDNDSQSYTVMHPGEAGPPKSDPHPGCSICHKIVQDGWTRAPGRVDEERHGEYKWSASRLFHAACDSCAEKEASVLLLCQFCQHLRLRHLTLCVPAHEFPANIPIARPDQTSTCPLCQFFLRLSHREYLPQERKARLEFPLYLSITQWHAEQVQWRVTGCDRWSTPAVFLVAQDDDQLLPVLQELFLTANHLRSSISHCSDHHELCMGLTDAIFPLNFRLIDVRKMCILTVTPKTRIEYVAFSYVWGESSDTDCSTGSNITKRLETLDISTLPATIRDAIVVCEKLGERYIWIDRLCILQDDEEDKLSQVHAMTSIYSAAKFVLVDASSSSMNDGMAGISRSRRAQINEKFCGLNINVQFPPLWDVVGPSTWNSRGWTYQEAILPKRKVFFTQSQIFYECALRIDHEETLAYSSFDPSTHDKARYPTTTTSLCYNAEKDCSAELGKTVLSSRTEKPWEAYARHLPRYRQRMLRRSSDLINAFLGITDALYAPGDSYHGLPLPDLDMALLWRKWKDPWIRNQPLNVTPEVQNDDLHHFPSWSWASVPDIIPDYDYLHRDFCGALCAWFRPAKTEGHLQPILAASQAVSRWKDTPSSLSLYRDANSSALREIWAEVLADVMIESPVCADAAAWKSKSLEELTEELSNRWPSYADFWQDVYGQQQALQDAEKRLATEVHDKIREGVIVTRTQVTSVDLRKVQPKRSFMASSEQEVFGVFNEQGHVIGGMYQDCTQRIEGCLCGVAGTFDCIALSMSTMEVQNDQELQALDTRECSSGEARDDQISLGADSQTSSRECGDGHWKLKPWINALIIRREDGCCYRVGLAHIDLNHWRELARNFETIVLA